MCGRFGLFAELDELAEQFNFDPSIMQDIYHPRWNIPPTVPVLGIQRSTRENVAGENRAGLLKWGMTAGWSKSQSKASRPLFNARGETVHRLPSFRDSFANRRCLIPANGFYEWKKDDSGTRTPVWFRRQDAAPVAFAGIWTSERTTDGDLASCAIITCDANDFVSPVHTRMPVILPPETYSQWLDPDASLYTLRELVQPAEWPDMTQYIVSTEVNRVANDHPALVEPAPRTAQMNLMD